MPSLLTIRHQGGLDGQAQFVVTRLSDGKTSEPVTITAPDQTTARGRGNSHLANDLRWYLERFLDYPFEPNIALAQTVQDTLAQWGKAAFSSLFQGKARDWYQDARRHSLSELTLKIASDNPRVLSWPWEALHDPEATTLAHTCRIERQLNELHDPQPLPDNLPGDCINILLVIARPYGEEDVSYHVLARPLVDLAVQQQTVPVRVDVLRPPTFDQLRAALREKPGFYHIVHFDGHGGYGEDDRQHAAGNHSFKGPRGRLVFETPEGRADAIESTRLTQLLSEYAIPITVLNACQSAAIDEQADDPFASVAAALLKAGIRSVVAMGYNLYVSAAQQFVPAFYQSLFLQGSVSEATRAGRQAMLAHPQRICARGEHPLYDWLVPVLYQQAAYDLNFTAASQPIKIDPIPLPPAATEQGDYGFIGRDRAIHALERAMRRQPQAGLLIHGIAGVGKTTLAQGFLQWLQQTNGLREHVFWFRFDEIRSAEYLINQIVLGLFGADALASPVKQKLENICRVFKEQSFILVWDNFESASGIDCTEVMGTAPLLSGDDRQQLKDFLQQLRGGKTKVLITSRSSESWLSKTECFRLPISGLQGEACWQYCNAVVRDLGLTLERDDPAIQKLIEKLDGHPLAMRAVLLRLDQTSAHELLQELEQGFVVPPVDGQDDSTRRIYSALSLLETEFPPEYTVVLQFIGLHQRYVQGDMLAAMIKSSEIASNQQTIHNCFHVLERAGLVHVLQKDLYAMHPALTGYLQQQHPAETDAQIAFVDLMGRFADHLTPKELHEQRAPFYYHGENFQAALVLAKTLGMSEAVTALTQSLASFAKNNRDFQGAKRLFEMLVNHCNQQRNEHGAASTYHQLGMIAEEQRDFRQAEQWYLKSLAITEKQGNEHHAASTYHQLGVIAQKQRKFEQARQWYRKSLTIAEKQGNEHGAAITYHQSGMIAQEQRKFEQAEQWYLKSLVIKEKQGNEQGMAITYHQLGMIAQEQRKFEQAEQWCLKSLAINEKQGDEYGVARTYHQLGVIAEKQRNLNQAEQWYLKSLAIKEKQGNEHGVASTYAQLGLFSASRLEWITAAQWSIKAIAAFVHCSDAHSVERATRQYINLLQQSDDQSQAEIRQRWQQAGMDKTIGALDDLITAMNKSKDA
ncbi:tetratricopeptide repeat protein [Nitrosomonas aestuarii]|uniref:tetratricopeptide repeat protein n=1 Tax=Nitrosomonas aestuarii TaxID=52441 RepID=UPI000D30BBCE|nr:tetratricopeptide repeat protein [Nitrosomonas aestuarii]PTN12783.1 tetratricopeptide repeat protein [Nitrosomonas aestuarii]